MTRREVTLGFAVAANATKSAKSQEMTSMFDEILTDSQNEKKGLTFYVEGQTIPGIVTKFDAKMVEARSQMHSRIVIRIDAIDAIAAS